MPRIGEKIRSFFQPIIRGYAAIKAGIAHTFETLRSYEPAISESAVIEDYTAYRDGVAIQELDEPLVADYLVPWYLHGKAPVNLSANFKYDVKAVYENIQGDTVDAYWSVIDDKRLTESEIVAMGTPFKTDSPQVDVEEYPFHGPLQVIACWRKD